jgi:hypothetical protein
MEVPENNEPAVVRATNGVDVLGILRLLAAREPKGQVLA